MLVVLFVLPLCEERVLEEKKNDFEPEFLIVLFHHSFTFSSLSSSP